MKLCSWNVNGLRAVHKKGFIHWFEAQHADVICLQETKIQPDQVPEDLLHPAGYAAHWHSAEKKGYSSLVTYSKQEPVSVRYGLGIKEFDCEGRVLITEFPRVTVINAYFPNSQRLGARLDYRLRFNKAVHRLMNKLRKQGAHVALCGDFNVAHQAIDLANPKANEKNAGYLPEERAWMDKFLSDGYIDTFRHFCDEPEQYTWWSYRNGVRARNIGWRLDYFAVNPELADRLKAAGIQAEVMGSDHCPVTLQLKR